jgi:hypothetical protein
MSSEELLTVRMKEMHEARIKEFEQNLLRHEALTDRDAKLQTDRVKQRRDFMASIGIDLTKFDAAAKEEHRMQEASLKEFLKEFRPELVERHPADAAAARETAIRNEVLAETGHMVLPVFASSILTPDKGLFADIGGLEWIDGPINSGWVWPDDPSKILIKDYRHYPNALCWDNRATHPTPEFNVYFGFVPGTTATYEMTAVLAFHGFYVLRCDDSWWNCRDSEVRLTVQMDAHQYTSNGWQNWTLLDVEKDNVDEVESYERTHFLDYTAALRAGDPVVVTVKGQVYASAHGGGAYAELNFADGTANYIQPLFLSVQQV